MTKSAITDADALLEGLDPQQRQAATALRGPVCVLAGAGTGKTRAITHRIAYGVATGTYSPDRVLALTFTHRAAGEMRNRLRQLGVADANANTFHSVALRQLSHFWPTVVGGSAPKVFASKSRPLAEVAAGLSLATDTAVLRDIATEVEWRKVKNLSIDEYAALAPEREMPGKLSTGNMVDVMRAYEKLKDDRFRIDMEDVLMLAAGMMEAEPSVAMNVQERYNFFVVDEYQDVSPLQEQLLELWLGDRDDLCVVGDASQTIYSFTGASSDYLLDFGTRYPEAELVKLETNYRSTASIVRSANELMRSQPGALDLHAVEETGGIQPDLTEYPTDAAEARSIASRIQQDIAGGVAPENIAVLYRINVQAREFEQALDDLGIGSVVLGQERFYELPEVKQAIMALRAASVSVVGEPLFKSVSDVLRSLGWTQSPPETGGAQRAKWESLNALMVMADEAPAGTTFRQFSDELLARQQAKHEPTRHAVNLATVHSAKGLEWEVVYLIGLSEGLFPITYATTPAAQAEERRLLYVALTRAKRALHLSWARQSTSGRAERAASPLLAELKKSVKANESFSF